MKRCNGRTLGQMDQRPDGWMDGQTLLWRCFDAPKSAMISKSKTRHPKYYHWSKMSLIIKMLKIIENDTNPWKIADYWIHSQSSKMKFIIQNVAKHQKCSWSSKISLTIKNVANHQRWRQSSKMSQIVEMPQIIINVTNHQKRGQSSKTSSIIENIANHHKCWWSSRMLSTINDVADHWKWHSSKTSPMFGNFTNLQKCRP